jgi:molybdate-binding protein/DNA-binding XRE family transcriptional regulator
LYAQHRRVYNTFIEESADSPCGRDCTIGVEAVILTGEFGVYSAPAAIEGSMKVHNQLAELRTARGLSAVEVAAMIDVSRQTVYAIESGDYAPNTAVALKLAQALGVTVEELFQLEARTDPGITYQAELLDDGLAASPGKPVCLCRVDGRLIATFPEATTWSLPLADAMITGVAARSTEAARATVELFAPAENFDKRLLIAGCDPGISILGRHLGQQGVNLVVAHRNSTRALDLLRRGSIHVAGCHIRDEKTNESNLAAIDRIFRKQDIAVVSLALWEEGLVVSKGNPKQIRSIADLGRSDVSIVNRERGAGSRLLLDAKLRSLGIAHARLRGYESIATGHMAAARWVQVGEADCCIAVLSVARALGLDFIPLASERYDLVVHRRHLHLPQVQALFNTLALASYRRELEHLGGYDTSVAGRRLI